MFQGFVQQLPVAVAMLTLLSAVPCTAATKLRAPLVEYPPYEYLDADEEAVGIIPAVVRELARRLGRDVEFLPSNQRSAQRGVQVGRFDIHVLPRTQELESDFIFAPTVLFHYRLVLLARPADATGANSLAELGYRRVAVQAHDMAETLLSRHPTVRRLTVPDYETGLRLVAEGHADYFLGNHDVCLHLINSGKAPHLTPILTNITLTPASVAIGRNSTPHFSDSVISALADMVTDGSLDQIRATWLGGDFILPVQPTWVMRHLRLLLLVSGATMAVLVLFVLLLRSLVLKRTRSLLQVQESLRRSEERYRQVFNTAGEAILIMDLKGVIQACSDYVYNLHGIRPEELVGRHVRELAPEEHAKDEDENIAYLCEHGQRVHTVERVKQDGERIEVELSERVIQWEQDPVIVSFAKDVTERMSAERALLQSEKKLEQAQRVEMAAIVAGQIAHDLNNLLTPLLGLPDLIREALPEGARAREDLKLIEMSAARMGEISQQLLTLGRRGHYTQTPLDMSKLVHDAVRTMSGRFPDDIDVQMDISNDKLPVVGGASQLMRALANILVNSVESMPEGGALYVETAKVRLRESVGEHDSVSEGEYARVTIRDEGGGIPEDVRERIFEPFFTTKQLSRQRGHGLGLSVVHGVVEDHKGYMDLQSEPGTGTTFTMYFPISSEPIIEEVPQATVHGTEHLLVVDDDRLQIDVFTRILSSMGYRVSGVGSGEEAVEFVREQEVDLLILDMVMEGGIDGAETYRRIKAFRPKQRVLFVSGYAESSVVAVAQKLGAGPVLRKPMAKDTLVNAVRAELDHPG